MSAIPTVHMNRRRYGAGRLWAAPLGTVVSSYAPTGTLSKFVAGTAATNVPGSTAFLPLGITTEGTEFSSSFKTEDDESAEYYYPLKTIVTGQDCSFKVELKTINLTNLRLAFNAATSAVSAVPGPSTPSKLTPPLPGAEIRVQVLWESLDEDMVIVLYQALQTNAVSIMGQKGAKGSNLKLEFQGELPDISIAPTPFDITVIGTSWLETVSGD